MTSPETTAAKLMESLVTTPTAPTPDHLVSALVRDEPRVLTRITSLFGRRGYNIKSLSVGTTEMPGAHDLCSQRR